MTRTADPKAKSNRVVFVPKEPEQEKAARALKEWCIRNQKTINEVLSEMVFDFLKRHHWPETPGHSQFQITEFTNGQKPKLVCERCGAEGVPRLYEAVFISGRQLKECEECFKRAKEHKLVKKFLKVITATHRGC